MITCNSVGRLLFRERHTQASEVDSNQSLQNKTTPTEVKTESIFINSGSAEDRLTQKGSAEEPMETQAAADDEQPKSKLKAVPHSSQTKSSQSSVSNIRQSGQISSTGSSVGGARDEEEMPYFPAHPISYFPEDVGSSASVTAQAPPPQQSGPFSIFDHQSSLYAISEDDPTIYVPILEHFQVSAHF